MRIRRLILMLTTSAGIALCAGCGRGESEAGSTRLVKPSTNDTGYRQLHREPASYLQHMP